MSLNENLMKEIVTQYKNEAMISVNESVRYQLNIKHMKQFMPDILIHVLSSWNNMVTWKNT